MTHKLLTQIIDTQAASKWGTMDSLMELDWLKRNTDQGISLKKYPPFELKPPLEKQGLSFQGGVFIQDLSLARAEKRRKS